MEDLLRNGYVKRNKDLPYKSEKIRLKPHQDRRRKLTDEDKEEIRNMKGLSQRKLAKMFGVSRRTIQFILDPAKLIANIERRKERGGWKQYYDKEKNTASIREHRRYKHTLFKQEGLSDK